MVVPGVDAVRRLFSYLLLHLHAVLVVAVPVVIMEVSLQRHTSVFLGLVAAALEPIASLRSVSAPVAHAEPAELVLARTIATRHVVATAVLLD